MDLIVRVNINVNGLAEEEFDLEVAKKLREATLIQYPDWVDDHRVNMVRSLKCFESIREMLLSGVPALQVARHIHLLNEWTQKKLESIRVDLEHFKATLPRMQMLARIVPTHRPEVKKRIDKSLDCSEALTEMYKLMMERIAIGMKREKSMEFLMAGMEKQFAVALEIVTRLHDIQKDLKEDPIDISNDLNGSHGVNRVDWSKIYTSTNATEIMSDPEKRTRLVRFVETIAKMGGAMSVEQQQNIMEAVKDKIEVSKGAL